MSVQPSHTTLWRRLSNQLGPEVQRLIERMRRTDNEMERERYEEKILDILKPLLRSVASCSSSRLSGCGHETEDYLVMAEIAAVQAIRSYDPNLNSSFFGYLYYVMRNNMARSVEREAPFSPSMYRRMKARNLNSDCGPLDPDLSTCYNLMHPMSIEDIPECEAYLMRPVEDEVIASLEQEEEHVWSLNL